MTALEVTSLSTQPEAFDCFICVAVMQYKTGDMKYAQAKLKCDGDTIGLLFQTAVEPFAEMAPYLDRHSDEFKSSIDENARPENFYAHEFLIGPFPEIAAQRVEQVLVNVFLPPSCTTGELDPVNNVLCCSIGWACRAKFPNMNPEESGFNIHSGFRHYRADGELLPSAAQAHAINLTDK